MGKPKTKLEKMSKEERTSLAYALATNLAKHGTPQTPKNERKLTKDEMEDKETHVKNFKKSLKLEETTSTVSKSRAKSSLKQIEKGKRDDGMGKFQI